MVTKQIIPLSRIGVFVYYLIAIALCFLLSYGWFVVIYELFHSFEFRQNDIGLYILLSIFLSFGTIVVPLNFINSIKMLRFRNLIEADDEKITFRELVPYHTGIVPNHTKTLYRKDISEIHYSKAKLVFGEYGVLFGKLLSYHSIRFMCGNEPSSIFVRTFLVAMSEKDIRHFLSSIQPLKQGI